MPDTPPTEPFVRWVGTTRPPEYRPDLGDEWIRTTLTITDFLLARIAEDEAVARAAAHDGDEWEQIWPGVGGVDVANPVSTESPFHYTVVFDEGSPSDEQAIHIARHDPAHVLAECEAKRWIVRFLDPAGMPEGEGRWVAEATLRILVTPYADHPDYREEWRP